MEKLRGGQKRKKVTFLVNLAQIFSLVFSLEGLKRKEEEKIKNPKVYSGRKLKVSEKKVCLLFTNNEGKGEF